MGTKRFVYVTMGVKTEHKLDMLTLIRSCMRTLRGSLIIICTIPTHTATVNCMRRSDTHTALSHKASTSAVGVRSCMCTCTCTYTAALLVNVNFKGQHLYTLSRP